MRMNFLTRAATAAVLAGCGSAAAQQPRQPGKINTSSAMILTAAGAPASTAPAPAGATGAAATQPLVDPGPWKAAIEQLGSEDFATRKAGATALQKATWRNLDLLRKLGKSASDPEVKEQLLARVQQIEEDLAANPPPITLQLDNANFSEMVDALGKALDRPLQAIGGRQGGPYTIHAVDKPFAQVLRELNEHGSVAVQGRGYQVLPGAAMFHGVTAGPLLIYPMNMVYQRTVNYQQAGPPAPGDATLALWLHIFADPRLKIVRYDGMELSTVRDSADHEMVRKPGQDGGPIVRAQRMNVGGQWMFNETVQLEPGGNARQVSLVKGTVRLEVGVEHQSREVPDMEKAVNTTINLAGRKITFSRFQVTPQKMIEFQMNMQTSGRALGNGNEDHGVTINMVDAKGKQVVTETTLGSWGGSLGGPYASPIKATFSVTTKSKELEIPFEIKDLPLP
ncbi:MAG TPA: hypothetical protein VHQ47_05435 [Phycisphaerae bacterium]|nr:hypothetical protein [Phycisphaerae bacterium]